MKSQKREGQIHLKMEFDELSALPQGFDEIMFVPATVKFYRSPIYELGNYLKKEGKLFFLPERDCVIDDYSTDDEPKYNVTINRISIPWQVWDLSQENQTKKNELIKKINSLYVQAIEPYFHGVKLVENGVFPDPRQPQQETYIVATGPKYEEINKGLKSIRSWPYHYIYPTKTV